MSKATKVIRHMEYLRNMGYKYSMYDRMSKNKRDCSSSVFEALIKAGVLTEGSYIGITDTLIEMGHAGRVLTPISGSQVRAGDIFVIGRRGASAGSAGHTGFFYGNGKIIHTNYRNNGTTINPIYFPMTTSPDRHFFRILEGADRMSTNEALKPLAKTAPKTTAIKLKNEKAKATCTVDYINIRTAPSTKAKVVDKLYKGMSVRYQSVWKGDGYRWLEFKTVNGDLRYIAYRAENNISDQWVRITP